MRILRVCEVYFSPCGSVKSVVSEMAQLAAKQLKVPLKIIDFTLPEARKDREYSFESTDLVFFGTPVYAGRVPNKIMPYIRDCFDGNGAVAVPVVVFGNRNYDDALAELRNLLELNHFFTIAGAAVVARHSFSKVIAPDRPNEKDFSDMRHFTLAVLNKVKEAYCAGEIMRVHLPGTQIPSKYYTPLGTDGKPALFLKVVPRTDTSACDQCGICAKKCPMGSIDIQDPQKVQGICIKCQACIRSCPKNAKFFDDEAFLSHKAMLEENYVKRSDSIYIV